MANNIAIYNAAIAGIIGGAKARRSKTINFTAVTATANKIDAAIAPDPDDMDEGKARLLRSICYGIFSRYSYINLDSRLITYVAAIYQSTIELLFAEPVIEGQAPPGEFRVSDIPDGSNVGDTIAWMGSAWEPVATVGVNKVIGTAGTDNAFMRLSEALELNINYEGYTYHPIDGYFALASGTTENETIRLRYGETGGYFAMSINQIIFGIERHHMTLDCTLLGWPFIVMQTGEIIGPEAWDTAGAIRMDALGCKFKYAGDHPGSHSFPSDPATPRILTAGMTDTQVINALVGWARSMFGWRTSL